MIFTKTPLLTLLLFILIKPLYGQPSPTEGGLAIGSYYTKTGIRIDTGGYDFEVRVFGLIERSANIKVSERSQSNQYDLDDGKDQRLLITFLKDTMVIDIIGIPDFSIGELKKGFGSIEFMPGYFRLHYSIYERLENTEPFTGILNKKMVEELSRIHFKPYDKYANVDYLDSSDSFNKGPTVIEYTPQLPICDYGPIQRRPLFYRMRGRQYLQSNLPNLALKDFYMGDCYYELYSFYKQAGKLDSALKYINLRLSYDPDDRKGLSNRGDLHSEMGDYKNAVLDYEQSLEGFYGNYIHWIEVAWLKTNKLGDTTGAILTIKKCLDHSQTNLVNCCRIDYELLFALGQLELLHKDTAFAFRHLLMSQENQVDASEYGRNFYYLDSLSKIFTSHWELSLSASIATYNMARSSNSSVLLDSALRLLNSISSPNYRVLFYKAKVYDLMGKDRKALRILNSSIELNGRYPCSYSYRYDLRSKLGKTTVAPVYDSDFKQYLDLSKSWELQRY